MAASILNDQAEIRLLVTICYAGSGSIGYCSGLGKRLFHIQMGVIQPFSWSFSFSHCRSIPSLSEKAAWKRNLSETFVRICRPTSVGMVVVFELVEMKL